MVRSLTIAATSPGAQTIPLDGYDRSGRPVFPGTYPCRALVTVGTYHYVAIDIETSYPGLRLFEVGAAGERSPLDMYWDDSVVQFDEGGSDRTIAMPTCDTSPELSPPTGLDPGPSAAAAEPFSDTCPSGNARAWGAFTTAAPLGKGDTAQLDTYTWIASEQAEAEITLTEPCAAEILFLDGFESGDTTRWAAMLP